MGQLSQLIFPHEIDIPRDRTKKTMMTRKEKSNKQDSETPNASTLELPKRPKIISVHESDTKRVRRMIDWDE
ncbi:hypothetical protein GWO43_29510 [candidate division KSB1 bacterium]|nr:hypothetical protein [candidate division KSB1 bacterium]NIR70141.1 hypothetical protein [candidate division KSB1 bacterium]NIS28053.1 hypothetical protein [candidate division KSB1 bacterium]NIT74922.1 hypothetical protein [candidate division KSB1 bacterium]NIU28706.1 hypothetical protein [candidate division KSB1 bacterium]